MRSLKKAIAATACVAASLSGLVAPATSSAADNAGAAPTAASVSNQLVSVSSPWMESILGTQGYVNGEIAQRYVAKAQRGDRIRISMYYIATNGPGKDGKFNSKLLNSLINAAKNGVVIEFLSDQTRLDDPGVKDRVNRYKTALESAGVKVTFCVQSCLGPKTTYSINHHKFFLFEYRGARDGIPAGGKVVVQSSANDHYSVLFEQAFAFDGTYYDNVWSQYDQAFESAKTAAKSGTRNWKGSRPNPFRRVSAFIGPFPPSARFDPQAAALNEVPAIAPGCRVDVVMGHWSYDKRGPALLKRIEALAAQGCKVRIVANPRDKAKQPLVTADQRSANISYACNEKVHAKYIALSYPQTKNGKTVTRQIVYSGSMNFQDGDLTTSDNAVVRIDLQAVYNSYAKYTSELMAATPRCN